jgi:hypothetical protein
VLDGPTAFNPESFLTPLGGFLDKVVGARFVASFVYQLLLAITFVFNLPGEELDSTVNVSWPVWNDL